ncbi:MAG: hypothetical protein J7501_08495 [Bdellovibrio sp.]|nr:hypothetical protein [Bdellovibrio sp.]
MKTLATLILVIFASNMSLAADSGYGYGSSSTRTKEQNKLITPDDAKVQSPGYDTSPRAANVHEDDWHDTMQKAPATKTNNEPTKFRSHVPLEQE